MAKVSPVGRAARAVASSLFEFLEDRKLFATVNVADFGAVANDGRDDYAAVNAAMNASKEGDTILFSGGTFQLSQALSTRGNRTYLGQDGATLQNTGQNFAFYTRTPGNGATFSNLSIKGRGFYMDTPNGVMVENITIDNCKVDVSGTSGEKRNAIEFTTGLRNTRITNNVFTNLASNGIYGYYWDRLTIANNQFIGGEEGMHVVDHRDDSRNLLIEQNYFANLRRMGIEYQGGGIDTIVQDNYYEKPSFSTVASQNASTFAYSIIADRSKNTIIRRNTSIAPDRPDGKGVRIVFEVGGDNCLVEENYSVGANHVLAANDGDGTTSVLARNNKFIGYLEAPRGRGLTSINNGPNVQLSWDINRGIPGPNKRYDGTTQPTPVPIPQVPSLPAVPVGLNLSVQDATSVAVTWSDPSGTDNGYTLSISSDGINWTDMGSVSTTGHLLSGLLAGLTYSVRVRAFNEVGASQNSSAVTVSMPVPASGNVTYLSDLGWTASKNGWGTAERDESNGERATGDGSAITLNGKAYTKGIGVHASSELRFNLNGEYSTFMSDIGLDDEVGSNGSVVFQVWADATKLYDSGTMRGSTATKSVSIDVSGKKELILVVTGAGDGVDWDHADWADARLSRVVATPKPSADPISLAALTPLVKINGWGVHELNRSNGERDATDGGVITLNGQTYAQGIGVHANSTLTYNLDCGYTKFKTDMGVDDEVGTAGSVIFQVFADGVKLFDSGLMTGSSETKTAEMDVTNKQLLSLVVTGGGDNVDNDHADWANPLLFV